ncbi:MAG: TIR domain-containing protein, partial [Lawsonibacter sp.]|nr:TIR domain-containing protein [Lawsonibacter sp.]
GVYESIVAEFSEEAEAYWGLVLCRYGIEYVDDPATGKKIPTCHRSSFDSIMEDSDFEQACENADAVARKVYREEAKAIEGIRRGIIEVSGKEAPYDIFICYKETAENGDRTIDSVIAQDVYDALTEKGYRVFFSRITLEDKLGQEYEPYIFAALNSAKIMLAFGTDYEYFNAVWVKNEWSRFLKLMAADKSKHLIPCYKGINAYDMPKEFAKLQAQDMGKVGAMQDLLRGIEKILPRKQPETVKETVVVQQTVPAGGPTVASLLKRGWIFLEDENWSSADEYFNKVLDIEPECGEAYLGKLMTELYVSKREALGNRENPFDNYRNYQKAIRFGSEVLRAELTGYNATIVERQRCIEQEHLEREAREQQERQERTHKQHAQIAVAGKSLSCSDSSTVGLKSDGTVVAVGNNKYGGRDVRRWTDIVAVSAGEYHIVGLKSDGTVVAVGDNTHGKCDVRGWTDIVAICAGSHYTVGLKSDGTVVAVGDNTHGKCDVLRSWTDIVSISASALHTVGLKSNGTVVTVGANDKGQCNVSDWTDIVAISAGTWHTVGLKSDDTVVAVGWNKRGQCNVSDWTDIVAISAGEEHTVGLRSDGTVVAVGDDGLGQCNVSGWRNIVAISAGFLHTAGLNSDGTVVAAGNNMRGQCDVGSWTDIIAVSADYSHTVGLKSDGTVVAAGFNKDGRCNVADWKDIVAIIARQYTVGLRADGTVVAVGYNEYGKCNVADWRDIVAVAGGDAYTVGLKSDGTVVAVGKNNDGRCNVSSWTDIVAVSAGYSHTVGLKSDGTVVAVGDNDDGRCDVSDRKLFNSLDTLEQERADTRKRAEEEKMRRKTALEQEKSALKTELTNLKGLFTGNRRKEIETRLAKIETELKGL